MNPFFQRAIAADDYETVIERQILGAGDLYELDGETFFRSHDGRLDRR